MAQNVMLLKQNGSKTHVMEAKWPKKYIYGSKIAQQLVLWKERLKSSCYGSKMAQKCVLCKQNGPKKSCFCLGAPPFKLIGYQLRQNLFILS